MNGPPPTTCQLDRSRRQRELDFHVVSNMLDWDRAEQLALEALQDRTLTAAERDAWRARLDVASRRITLG